MGFNEVRNRPADHRQRIRFGRARGRVLASAILSVPPAERSVAERIDRIRGSITSPRLAFGGSYAAVPEHPRRSAPGPTAPTLRPLRHGRRSPPRFRPSSVPPFARSVRDYALSRSPVSRRVRRMLITGVTPTPPTMKTAPPASGGRRPGCLRPGGSRSAAFRRACSSPRHGSIARHLTGRMCPAGFARTRNTCESKGSGMPYRSSVGRALGMMSGGLGTRFSHIRQASSEVAYVDGEFASHKRISPVHWVTGG
jgi:hypothetical protein